MTRAHRKADARAKPRRGRPPKPLDPEASRAARLGAELRALRTAHGLTLEGLSARVDYSPQHVSQVEHGRATVTEVFLRACDAELGADGALLRRLPAVVMEDARRRAARAAARRGTALHGDHDADPAEHHDRVGTDAAEVQGPGAGAAPVAARGVDPALPGHLERLLAIVGSHDAVHGPHEALRVIRRELHAIAEHRQVARGGLRSALMVVEAQWVIFAAWLCEDTGDRRGRVALLERGLRLAREADHPDLVAWARARHAQWSDAPRAMRLAEAALRTPRAGAQTRALCAIRAAHAHALIGDAEGTSRMLAEAHDLAAQESPDPPLAVGLAVADHVVHRWEARCWAALEPATGIALYDELLRAWPRGFTRDGGLYVARLARACAEAGELDRARAEGRKALVVARATDSRVAARELARLTVVLRADNDGLG